jgi:hypothetical protein
MRLLKRESGGEIILTRYRDKKSPVVRNTISYLRGEEILLQEVEAGTSEGKHGRKKIELCVTQAARNCLQYFWVDTCCGIQR